METVQISIVKQNPGGYFCDKNLFKHENKKNSSPAHRTFQLQHHLRTGNEKKR